MTAILLAVTATTWSPASKTRLAAPLRGIQSSWSMDVGLYRSCCSTYCGASPSVASQLAHARPPLGARKLMMAVERAIAFHDALHDRVTDAKKKLISVREAMERLADEIEQG